MSLVHRDLWDRFWKILLRSSHSIENDAIMIFSFRRFEWNKIKSNDLICFRQIKIKKNEQVYVVKWRFDHNSKSMLIRNSRLMPNTQLSKGSKMPSSKCVLSIEISEIGFGRSCWGQAIGLKMMASWSSLSGALNGIK